MSVKDINIRVGRQGPWIMVAQGLGEHPRVLFRLSPGEADSFGKRLIALAAIEEPANASQFEEPKVVSLKPNEASTTAALYHIIRTCTAGVDQSDDDIEAAFAGIREIAQRALGMAVLADPNSVAREVFGDPPKVVK